MTNAFALYLVDPYRLVHQHIRYRADFERGIPAINIERRVGFSNAHTQGRADGFVKAPASLHLGQDHIRSGVEQTTETLDMERGQRLLKESETIPAIIVEGEEREFR